MITTVDTPASRCLWGLAEVDITPPVRIYHRMWGASRHDRATGVHRPLRAAALAWADLRRSDVVPFVLLALDHCLLWPAEMADLRAAILDRLSLPPERVIVTFSHTHAAGLVDRTRDQLPGGELIRPYFEELCRRVADCAQQACQNLVPVTISYATGRCTLAGHRDAWDRSSQQWVCGWNPEGPADDTVLVARITATTSEPRPASTESGSPSKHLATVVNYACHPTTLAWDNSLISPDYIGALRETIEQATGAPCVFLQGASGDLGPCDGFVSDPAVADRNGRQLAYAALSALESLPPPDTCQEYVGPVLSGATLGAWRHRPRTHEENQRLTEFVFRRVTVPLPYRPDRPTLAELEQERSAWLAKEQAAWSLQDERGAMAARAMVERCSRAITRWSQCPGGEFFPYQLTCLRLGEAVWVWGEGELYQDFQRELRRRCPQRTLIINELADGWRCSYLPPQATYGRGIYQEQVAILAPGCLEQLIEAATALVSSL